MNFTDEVLNIIADYKGLSRFKLTSQRTLEELGIDSLDVVDIIWEIENKLSIKVPEHAVPWREIVTIADLTKAVSRLDGRSDETDTCVP